MAWLELSMFLENCCNLIQQGGGVEADSDGVTFADFVHHEHPIFDQHYEAIIPANHGQFPAEKLPAVWKTIQNLSMMS